MCLYVSDLKRESVKSSAGMLWVWIVQNSWSDKCTDGGFVVLSCSYRMCLIKVFIVFILNLSRLNRNSISCWCQIILAWICKQFTKEFLLVIYFYNAALVRLTILIKNKIIKFHSDIRVQSSELKPFIK